MPGIPAVTKPVDDPMVATVVLLLAQVPPAVASESVSVLPTHSGAIPVIPAGAGSTVTVVVRIHPVDNSVNVIGAVPAAMPVTILDVVPTVATAVLPLCHVPVPASLSIVVEPTQTFVLPVIGPGKAFTVINAVALQPVVAVYVILTVPLVIPVTNPVMEPIVATAGLLLAHVPPVAASLRVTVEPTHTLVGPAIAGGPGFTVTVVVAIHPVDKV